MSELAIKPVDYHSDFSAISNSMLSDFLESRRLYEGRYVTGTIPRKEPSDRMDTGSIIHAVLLEQKPLRSIVEKYPKSCLKSNGHKNAGPCKQFESECRDKGIEYVVKDDQFDLIRAVTNEFRRSLVYTWIDREETLREHTIYWTNELGQKCRCKIDFAIPLSDRVLAFDLKCTDFHTPQAWAKEVKYKKRYQTQLCHYSDGLKREFPDETADGMKRIEWRWICVNPSAPVTPGSVCVNRLEEPDREQYPGVKWDVDVMNEMYWSTMRDLKACYESGDWSDPHEGRENVLQLYLGAKR